MRDNVDVVNRLTFRGWEGSAEAFPFHRFRYLGIVLDGSGFYRTGVTQYNLVLGPRVSKNYGKWRVFAHAMGGNQEAKSSGETFHTVILRLSAAERTANSIQELFLAAAVRLRAQPSVKRQPERFPGHDRSGVALLRGSPGSIINV